MNIKILDGWLKEYLETDATPKQIAEAMSLTSVSVERIEEYEGDKLYDIEVTTNRPDLMSVVGLAREAAAILPEFGYKASFKYPSLAKPKTGTGAKIEIINNPKLVKRILAVVMEVKPKKSPAKIQKYLESSDVRSLNSVIDVTNYVMRVTGHPAHAFDFDLLNTAKLTITESKINDKIETLDKKNHTLKGGDIIAIDDKGRIVDLLGVMGLANSTVQDNTKRILFFINNNNPNLIRKTSMGLAIRTDAAQLNEKELDAKLAEDAFVLGIKLFEEIAEGKVISELYDIYPIKQPKITINLDPEHLEKLVGVKISKEKAVNILKKLEFEVTEKNNELMVTVPSFRSDIRIEEDLIEEIARVYGYHKLPSLLVPDTKLKPFRLGEFYWEDRIKDALKYWGFTETYTYSMVSEKQYESSPKDAVAIRNPLTEDHVYMRSSLVPSLLEVKKQNKSFENIRIFEIANIYLKNAQSLPTQKHMLAGLISQKKTSFFETKGILEQMLTDLGISNVRFQKLTEGGIGANVLLGKEKIGEIEVLDEQTVDFELDFASIAKHATLKKVYKPLRKYPGMSEDITLVLTDEIETGEVLEEIKSQSELVVEATLKDKYKDARTFHIVYQDNSKNLTNEKVGELRKKIVSALEKKFSAKVK